MADATTFAFRAMDVGGIATAGEVEAESKAQVTEQLRQRGLIVLDVSEKSEPFKLEDIWRRWKGVDMRELAIFSRQFATLVASGMPMLRTLHTLEAQTQDERIREAVVGLRADIEAGSTLEQGWSATPRSSTASTGRWCAPARNRAASRTPSTGSPTRSRKAMRCGDRSNRR
jgi:type IV pilus assembly protein PilC